jgi:hypothetical protein
MQIELVIQQDDSFKLVGLNSNRTQIEEPKHPVEDVPVEDVPVEDVNYQQPKPAPIENQKGLDWFNGTSWGNS